MTERNVAPGDGLLAHAARQRGALDGYTIVDADAHHFEQDVWAEIVELIPDYVFRNTGRNPRPGRPSFIPKPLGSTDISGRLMRDPGILAEDSGDADHADAAAVGRYMAAMGVATSLLSPTSMQFLGLHPQPEAEVNLAHAYNRWAVEILARPGASHRPFLYLPVNDPEACVREVETFGDAPGIAGFMVAAARYRPIHDNRYMPTYARLEERGLPLAFHAAHDWNDLGISQANRYLGVYALNFPEFNMLHMTNWIVNGLPERFPGLKLVWMEGGIAWVPYLMQRLDSTYRMRTSEAPALTRLPSEYMREMYYTSHPMDVLGDEAAAEFAFERIDAETQLMWASGYPQWNFDLPGAIAGLPFLTEAAKRNILGGNAHRLFRLGPI